MANKNPNYVLRTVNLKRDVFDLIKAESERRRNGDSGFSLTLNQIVLQWLDFRNTDCGEVDTKDLQEIPAVKALSVPLETDPSTTLGAGG